MKRTYPIYILLILFFLFTLNVFADSYICNDGQGNHGFYDSELMKKGMCYKPYEVKQKTASGECSLSIYTTKDGKSYGTGSSHIAGINSQNELNACLNKLIQRYSIVNMSLMK
ncbi:MAG: hypothetical protein MJ231_06995 [bacterium]|nr:hypothetical protein [bacterium]